MLDKVLIKGKEVITKEQFDDTIGIFSKIPMFYVDISLDKGSNGAYSNTIPKREYYKFEHIVNTCIKNKLGTALVLTTSKSAGRTHHAIFVWCGWNSLYNNEPNTSGYALVGIPYPEWGNSYCVNKTLWIRGTVNLEGTFYANEVSINTGKIVYLDNINDKVNASAVLTKTNTTPYTPTSDYHPATKKYVDELFGNLEKILSTLTTVDEEQ